MKAPAGPSQILKTEVTDALRTEVTSVTDANKHHQGFSSTILVLRFSIKQAHKK